MVLVLFDGLLLELFVLLVGLSLVGCWLWLFVLVLLVVLVV